MHIGAEDEVAELGERQEDDAEHDGEGDEVLGGVVDGCRHVAHRVGEVEVFEQLQQRIMPSSASVQLGEKIAVNRFTSYSQH